MTEVTSDKSSKSSSNNSDYDDISMDQNNFVEINESIQDHEVEENIYEVTIKKGMNELELNFIENQFYEVTLLRKNTLYGKVICRRFSDFVFFFTTLEKKHKGFIFPAFPSSNIYSYVKSKVSVVKDDVFISRRIQMIERFFNKILSIDMFDPEKNYDVKNFLVDEEFECIKKVEKQKISITDNLNWNKIKSYLYVTKKSKNTEFIEQLNRQKKEFEEESARFKELEELLKEEQIATIKFLEESVNIENFNEVKKLLETCVERQKANLIEVEKNEFESSCLCEDIKMAHRILDEIEELKTKEEDYIQAISVENIFKREFISFNIKKQNSLVDLKESYKKLLKAISIAGVIQ